MKNTSVTFFLLAAMSISCSGNEEKPGQNYDPENHEYEININDTEYQLLRFGVDLERLWYYWPNQRSALVQKAAKELNAAYARVAINPAYEREEGNFNTSAYENDIIPLMSDLKKINPEIEFYASPRPLKEAYDKKNTADAELLSRYFKNGDPGMFPYPIWVGGNKNVLTDRYKRLDKDKMARYLTDYLNMMGEYGFEISWMDLTNEYQDFWEGDIATIIYIINEVEKGLDAGVKMPEIIFPSTWSPDDGFKKFLNVSSVAGNEKDIFNRLGAVSTHNTPDKDIASFNKEALYRFADAVHSIDPDKELWNTEMHGWVGVYDPASDIRNSEILWQHILAGFTGIDTWLFFGSYDGSGHSMVYSNNNNAPVSTAKYEIFKSVVNEINLGHRIGVSSDNRNVTSVAMRKGDTIVLVMHNMSDTFHKFKINMPASVSSVRTLNTKLWKERLKNITPIESTETDCPVSFTIDIDSSSLIILTMEVE